MVNKRKKNVPSKKKKKNIGNTKISYLFTLITNLLLFFFSGFLRDMEIDKRTSEMAFS